MKDALTILVAVPVGVLFDVSLYRSAPSSMSYMAPSDFMSCDYAEWPSNNGWLAQVRALAISFLIRER